MKACITDRMQQEEHTTLFQEQQKEHPAKHAEGDQNLPPQNTLFW